MSKSTAYRRRSKYDPPAVLCALNSIVDGASAFAIKRQVQVLSDSNQRADAQNREFGIRRHDAGTAIGWLFNMESVIESDVMDTC